MDSRLLVACHACARQWDVTRLERGAAFDCACGVKLYAKAYTAHSPRALRCSNCGGNLRDGAHACDYCSAEITLEERRLDSVCPHCFARMSSEAHYCMDCGTHIVPQMVEATALGVTCPRCRKGMLSRAVGGVAVIECDGCRGMWLEPGGFDEICNTALMTGVAAVMDYHSPVLRERAPEKHPLVYLPCPTCSDMMVRKNFGGASGVIVDICGQHGVWLDARELERVVAYLRAGGRRERLPSPMANSSGELVEWKPSSRKMTSSLFGTDVRPDEGDELGRMLRVLGDGLSRFFGLF